LKKNERYKEKIISDYLGVFLESKSQLAIQKSLEELETLKKSLMQEYFG
ncbi:restriction endonuclease subunit S, partial [Streptococcus pneumoniae]